MNTTITRADVDALVAELDAATEQITDLLTELRAEREHGKELTITLEWIASHPRGCDGDTAADQMQAKARTALEQR